MKISEVRQLKDNEIEVKLLESKKELFNLRFQQVAGQLTNTARTRQVRKTVAKLRTILTERSKKSGVSDA